MDSDAETKAYKTCTEMLEQRGYVITLADETNHRIEAEKEDGSTMIVFFIQNPKLDIHTMRDIIGEMGTREIKHAILVYEVGVTPPPNEIINTSRDFKFELFKLASLTFNITKHVLVPKHVRLPEEEAAEMRKKYPKLPIILRTDAVSRFYAFESNDVIMIERKNKRGGIDMSLRIVR